MLTPTSNKALILCVVTLLIAGTYFYPKWKKSGTEATISWDVSGYYFYLPAIFIYHDIKELSFKDEILKKYKPTPDFQQAFMYENGNYVMKYPLGQAIQMSPFFLLGHLYALIDSEYPSDGFSRPYQFFIYLGGFLIAFVGLYYLRKILLYYYSDAVTAWTLFLIVFCSNYLEYSGITNAMTHNNLFTLYALLIFNTIRFYDKFLWKNLFAIGSIIGLMALTRPTEILAVIIPVCWGLNDLKMESLKIKLSLFNRERNKITVAVMLIFFIGFIQLSYWKYVTGEWLVYSYEDQGFSWLRPHIIDGLLSYKSGWLVYSPIFFFALPGFYYLYKSRRCLFWPSILFLSAFIYVAFAWDIWWYGGSLGQRTMVQTYPIVAFSLAAFIERINGKKIYKWTFVLVCMIFAYYNFWLVYQAHGGGLLRVSQMTKSYFWEVVGRFEIDNDKLKLLDNKDYYRGEPISPIILYDNDFENNKEDCFVEPINGSGSLCLKPGENFSPEFRIKYSESMAKWIRATASFKASSKEWDVWKMPQFIIKFYNNNIEIKSNAIRVNRFLENTETRKIHIDAKIPTDKFDEIGILFWNPGSPGSLIIDDLKLETF